MRKTLLLTSVLLLTVNLLAQKVIENPYFEVKNSGIDNITRIELSDKDTRVHVHTTFLHNWWVKFPRGTFIQPVGSDQKLIATGIEKGEFDKEIYMPESADSTFVLIFPPLDKSIKKINYGEDEKTIVFGISLETNKKKLADLKKEKARKELEKQYQAEIWLNTQLNGADKNVLIKDFTADNFFRNDTARLIGYIKGYDPQLGFSTSILYMGNELTREDYPTVMKIDSTGRFEVNIWLQYPIVQYLRIDNKRVSDIYLEPGQSLGLVLDWQEFLIADRLRNIQYRQKVEFKGCLADLNKEINSIELKQYEWREFEKECKTLSPDDFKKNTLSLLSENKALIENAVRERKLSDKSKRILHSTNIIRTGERLFNYTSMRTYFALEDTTNQVLKIPVENNYYDFLQQIPLNDPSLLVSLGFNSFINQFEYCQPFTGIYKRLNETQRPEKTFYKYMEDESDITITDEERELIDNLREENEQSNEYYKKNENVIKKFHEKYKDEFTTYKDKYVKSYDQDVYERMIKEYRDSVYLNVLNLQPSLTYDIVKMRDICVKMKNTRERNKAEKLVTEFAKGNTHPYLKKQIMNFFNNEYPLDGSTSYELGNTNSALLFKKMIEPFKGKYILVDFWESWCGPCVGGIKSSKETREKLKDNKDIAFLFICSTDTPLDKYNSFSEEQGLHHSFRLTASEYEYMRELFKFNGIPHYETVDREGLIMRRGLSPYTIEPSLQLFLEKEKENKKE